MLPTCFLVALLAGSMPIAGAPRAPRQDPHSIGIRGVWKLTDVVPGFRDTLDPLDAFGTALARIGDVDGDGVEDLAVGAPGDDDGGPSRGAVYVLFRQRDGSVRARTKISATAGGFGGAITNESRFGSALVGLGDLDGDGVPDLAVGSPGERAGDSDSHGAIWLLFLRSDGGVKSHARLDRSTPGLDLSTTTGGLMFGSALACPGDWNGDGTPDLACVGTLPSVFWMVFLRADGSVARSQRNPTISICGDSLSFCDDLDGDGLRELLTTRQGSLGVLFLDASGARRRLERPFGLNGRLAAAACDVDGDGRREVVVGVRDSWTIEVLRLDANGSLASRQSLSAAPLLDSRFSGFGRGVGDLGDVDGDGHSEVGCGAPDSFPSKSAGAVFSFELAPGGTLEEIRRLSDVDGAMAGTLDPGDGFAAASCTVGDVDGDGTLDLAIGAPADSSLSGAATGVVWLLAMNPDGSVKARRRLAPGEAGFLGSVEGGDLFGSALAAIGDLDGDGTPDLVVGAPGDADGARGSGAIWVLYLLPDGRVKGHTKISERSGLFDGLSRDDAFGQALAAAGDMDGSGTCDLFVGAPGDDDGGRDRGAVWFVRLRRDGQAGFRRKISALEGGFSGVLPDFARFGSAVATLGDVDGDGNVDLAVGAPNDDVSSFRSGAAWVLLLHADGLVRDAQRIAQGAGGFGGVLDGVDAFGSALAGPGDLDGDGVRDLVVGAPGDDDVAFDSGAVWLLSLDRTGRSVRERKFRRGAGPASAFPFPVRFGSSLAVAGDADGDGVSELAVGAPGDVGAREGHGALWFLFLDALTALDFERRFDSTPALDGLALPSGSRLGKLGTLHTTGSNLGGALFDSRPGGPNDPSQDPDLLVGLGKVLILQNPLVSLQTWPGYFDRPNDEPSGGGLRFTFDRRVAPLSLILVDIDQRGARVGLTDRLGGVRIFDVPAAWTGDRLTDGTRGFRKLDLTTLAPQPGFGGSVVASETPGFLARRVVQIEVELAGSGAVDELVLDPWP